MTKEEAWEYAFGMIRVDNLTPSDELLELAKKEIAGEITMEDIIHRLDEKYGKRKTI